MKEVDISVIMPVYNAEKFLKRSIKSVLFQEKENFELIIVNDGSKDRTGELAKSYSEKYPWITVIDQDNAGPLAAIRTGIQYAKGEYITFIDADDEYHGSFLKDMYEAALEQGADISVCGFYYRTGEADLEFIMSDKTECYDKAYIDGVLLEEFLACRKLQGARWNKLYRREIIEKSIMKIPYDLKYGEDVVMVLGAILESNTIVVLDKCLYYYYDIEQSLQKRMRQLSMKMLPVEEMYNGELGILKDYGRMDLMPYAAYNYYTEIMYFFKIILNSSLKRSKKRVMMKEILEEEITVFILEHAKKKTWKSAMVCWLLRRKMIAVVALLMRISRY